MRKNAIICLFWCVISPVLNAKQASIGLIVKLVSYLCVDWKDLRISFESSAPT